MMPIREARLVSESVSPFLIAKVALFGVVAPIGLFLAIWNRVSLGEDETEEFLFLVGLDVVKDSGKKIYKNHTVALQRKEDSHFILRIRTSIPLVSFNKATSLEVSVSP
jgi:hypothetical protein